MTDISRDDTSHKWKQRLYGAYVSSGQAASHVAGGASLRLESYPYYRHLISRILPGDKRIRIADLACGHGALVFCLHACGYESSWGVDASAEQVGLARKLGIANIELGDVEGFLDGATDRFDVIFMMDVLEHFTKQELLDVLDKVRRALKPGGRLIAHVPNAEGIFGMRIRYGDLTHENCFTRQSISQALRACHFGNVQCLEDKPIVHGAKSFVRRMLWALLTAPARLLLTAETGERGHILSQNLLVVAEADAA